MILFVRLGSFRLVFKYPESSANLLAPRKSYKEYWKSSLQIAVQ